MPSWYILPTLYKIGILYTVLKVIKALLFFNLSTAQPPLNETYTQPVSPFKGPIYHCDEIDTE